MASFMTSLWESIFVPGPTPTLLIATNATFGALQILLLILLVTTQSIHFIVLSFLCAGLWYAINWFAAELAAVKAKEEQEHKEGSGGDKKEKERDRRRRTSPELGGSDTETEVEPRSSTTTTGAEVQTQKEKEKVERRKPPPKPVDSPVRASLQEAAEQSIGTSPESQHLSPDASGDAVKGMGDSDLLRRRRSLGESSGYVSTDSEWEKVGEEEGKK